MKNFIGISRKIFKHSFWEERREFSRFEAWLDLLKSAGFTDENEKIINGKVIKYGRGQYPASLSFLSQRWGWSVGKVRNFLQQLKKSTMIDTHNAQGTTMITVCKYDTYNGEQQTGRTKRARTPAVNKQQYKECKEEFINKLKEIYMAPENVLNWANESLEQVFAMGEPLTAEYFHKAVEENGLKRVKQKLEAMENRPKLTKDYVSANKTLSNWLSK